MVSAGGKGDGRRVEPEISDLFAFVLSLVLKVGGQLKYLRIQIFRVGGKGQREQVVAN